MARAKFSRKDKVIKAIHEDVKKDLNGKGQKTFPSINTAKRFSRMLSKKFGHGINLSN